MMHIVNYQEGGYAIVSSDTRTVPILAIIPEGKALMKGDTVNAGLAQWMSNQLTLIDGLKKGVFYFKQNDSTRNQESAVARVQAVRYGALLN